jgi:hypothetical protein
MVRLYKEGKLQKNIEKAPFVAAVMRQIPGSASEQMYIQK